MTRYAAPGTEGAIVSYESRYDHFIGGEYVPMQPAASTSRTRAP